MHFLELDDGDEVLLRKDEASAVGFVPLLSDHEIHPQLLAAVAGHLLRRDERPEPVEEVLVEHVERELDG